MNQELGSLMSHFYRNMPEAVAVYTFNVPEGMKSPSLFFPPPITIDSKFTSHSYQVSYTLNAKLFHTDQQHAFTQAEAIANSLRKQRFTYALYDEEGNDTGKRKKVRSVNVRMLSQPDDNLHVAQITVEWDSRYAFDQALNAEKMLNIFINMNKLGTLTFEQVEEQPTTWDIVENFNPTYNEIK